MPDESEFLIRPNLVAFLRVFFYSQLFVKVPHPSTSFTGKTVIVTGSNSGLGLEAARQFYRLGAEKLILAVRNVSKGQAAKEDILASVKERARDDPSAIEIWTLDQSSTASTTAFIERVKTDLARLDAVVLNAGLNSPTFKLCDDGYEEVTQVNVLNTFLLALSLIPKLRDTAIRFSAEYKSQKPHLTIVSSEAHHLTRFDEINKGGIREGGGLYAHLNDPEAYQQQPRYQATKLMEVLLVRELVARLPPTSSCPVTINMVNPGLCFSNLTDINSVSSGFSLKGLMMRILFRTADTGGRCLVLAASTANHDESHGEFQSDGKNQDVEGWIYTDMGKRVQEKVWEETMAILEERRPGISEEIGV